MINGSRGATAQRTFFFNNLNYTAMKKAIILAVSLLMFTTSQAIHKGKKKSKAKVVKMIPQGTNDGMQMYHVQLSDGRVYELMYMSEIKEAQRTGLWKYNEMLEYKSSAKKTYQCYALESN